MRSTLLLLLALTGTANAALSRVSLAATQTPVSALPWAAAPAALPLSPAALDAAVLSAPLPLPAALPAPAAPAAAQAATSAAAPASAAASGPKILDVSNAHAPLSGELAAPAPSESSESAAQALESLFDEAAKPADTAQTPLLARLLQLVRLDDGGIPEHRAALLRGFTRMLETPTARTLAERFIAAGVPAVVRFEAVEGSRIHEVDGRKIFYAPRAFTGWRGDHVEVSMNRDYLDTSAEFQEQDLPPTLAHELFGHGLWYSRAAREDALLAFHHHELNEANARLVGWLVDFEMDRRFEEGAPWSYMRDPAGFMSYLKLRLPYYAVTWSTPELARPRETLEERSRAAHAKREELRRVLSDHLTWNQVIDHFAAEHGVSEKRLRALRAYMDETAKGHEAEIAMMDSLIAVVDGVVAGMNAEGDGTEQYLRQAAAHPLFADLQAEADEHTRLLIEQVSRAAAKSGDESPASSKAREEHWRGQITFDELVKMYEEDVQKNPAHWLR